jgi:predicted nucleic acid-binding protein
VVPAAVLVEVDYFLVDGVVAALAERLRIYRILTIDHEDFGPLRVGERYTQRLEIVSKLRMEAW